MTLVMNDLFDSLDSTRWFTYENSNFGSPDRVQLYKAANVSVGVGSTGATNGTSLKLISKREDVAFGGKTYNFTAGMLDTKSTGTYFCRYGRFEFRCKIPHGQGLWPSIWITTKGGGATLAEIDIMEYFHAQIPGRNSATMHGTDNAGTFHKNWYTNNGAAVNGGWGRTFFEKPTYSPGWHTWTADIIPVTDSTGATKGDIHSPSNFVKVTMYLDGVKVFEFVNTASTNWTTNGGSEDAFWQIYVQGCQIDGPYIGGIDDPLGYSHETGACLISGTPPNSCTITRDGANFIQRAQFGDPSSVLEVDFIRVYKLTS